MKLSIVTINYNGFESTIKLLNSLSEQTDKDFQTIVIDNASEEADFNNLQSTKCTFAKVPFVVRNEENLGFSGGNNVGIRRALENGSEWILLLNNDTWVEKDFISALKAKLGDLRGVVGVPLVEDGQAAYAGKIQWLKVTLEHARLRPIIRHRKSDNYVIGGGVAIHRNVFEKIGLLDEKYFLYFEDADFSLKTQRAGFPLAVLEEPKAYHQVSSTTKKLGPSLLLRYHYRNSLYFNWKNGPWHIKLLIWPWSFWIIKKQLLKIMFMHKQEDSLAILKGVFDFYRNKMGRIDL